MNTNNMKYLIMSAIVITLIGFQAVYARQLPLNEISDPSCKATHRTEHGSSCKLAFILPEETVISWPQKTSQKLLFSVLYESSYHTNDGETWGHPGIDIVSAKGTPLYAIHDWIVEKSEHINGYGNTVILKHQDGDDIIYSSYAHLDKSHVSAWEKVLWWELIGEIGNTGFTMGPLWNHVDFQIITAASPTTPYAYADCDTGYMEAVQHWLCKTQLHKATHNPFEFLHNKINKEIEIELLIEGSKDQEILKTPILLENKNETLNKVQEFLEKNENFKESIIQWEQAKKPLTSAASVTKKEIVLPKSKVDTIERDSLPFDLTATVSTETLWVGRLWKISFELKDKQGKPLSGLLSKSVTINTNSDTLKLYFDEFQFVSQGKKQLLFKWQKSWMTTLSIAVDGQVIQKFEVEVE